MGKKEEKIIDFSQLIQHGGLLVGCEPLINRLGEQVEIVSVDYARMQRYGEVAIITARDGNKYYTFSRVVIDQLRKIEDALKKGYIVRARIARKKRYLTLE